MTVVFLFSCAEDDSLACDGIVQLSTENATVTDSNTAILSGSFEYPECLSGAISKGFVYAKNEAPSTVDATIDVKDGENTVILTELELSTQYYCRAYIKTSDKTYYGNQISFVTDKLPAYNIGQVEVNIAFNPDLNIVGGFAIVSGGLRGILVVCVNPAKNEYLAFDLATPHLSLEECAAAMRYDVSTSFNCISRCDSNAISYNIFDPETEVDGLIFRMRQYEAIGDGQRIVITNKHYKVTKNNN